MSDMEDDVAELDENPPRRWATIVAALVLGLASWGCFASGPFDSAFDAVAHQFYEVPVLAKIRRPTQLPLARAHAAILLAASAVGSLASTRLSPHGRRWVGVFLVGYALRASAWVAGGNLPLVPGDSCHYLEVATSVYRGEGPVKHYVESFFADYPAIRQGRGVLDDWATPLYAYVLAVAYRLVGVVPGVDLERSVAVAKGVSFVFNLLALPAVYGFGRRRFNASVGLGAMALLAVLPVHVIYAGFGLRESLVGLTSLLAVWALTEVWSVTATRPAFAWALAAGLFGGLAILARNTAMALAAGAGLYGLVVHGRRRLGPLLLAGVVMAIVIAPWAWVTAQEYGRPFYTYTGYFPYNFSWTVHHYEKGNTRASEFYTAANAPAIARVKLKSLLIIATTSTMILSLPLTVAALRRVRRGGDTDRLVAALALVFVSATLVNVADVTQVAQLGRYYLPLFMIILPTAAAGVRDLLANGLIGGTTRRWLAAGLVALLWAEPAWAHDATWFSSPYQLHWPALRAAGDWVRAHPEAVPPDARVMTWFPWEFRVAGDRTTVLMPRNYRLQRVDEVIRQYGVTHVLWGSFEPPPDVDPEAWGPYLSGLRVGLGLVDDREVYTSPKNTAYPVRLYRLRPVGGR